MGEGDPAALYDVRPVRRETAQSRSISELNLKADSVLEGPARLLWGLEEAQWHIIGVRTTVPDPRHSPGKA